jgi:hypothetical protein
MSKSIPNWVSPSGGLFPIGPKKRVILGHDDINFSDFLDLDIDRMNGDRLAFEIGTTWIKYDGREYTSTREWTVISKALRMHGYKIVPVEEE